MYSFAEFTIQGYVGKITILGTTLKISIGVTSRWNDPDTGEVKEKTRWNTVTVFQKRAGYDWLKVNLKTSDLVHSRGSVEETSYTDAGGVKQYGVSLIADFVSVIPTGNGEEKPEETPE
jgi:single-strand DNA-binding protein